MSRGIKNNQKGGKNKYCVLKLETFLCALKCNLLKYLLLKNTYIYVSNNNYEDVWHNFY